MTSVTPTKRWKRSSKFLLGGNIRDPLNLNSLSDEKVSQVANAVTPEYSPLPTPKHRKAEYKIEVLIPTNISDPLNLMQNDNDDEYDASFNKKKSRHRRRYNHHSSNKGEVKKVRFSEEQAEVKVEEVKKEEKKESLVVPAVVEEETKPSQHQTKKFQYGNYSRYYGYRLEGSDPRLGFFDPQWFQNKDVLDIGCNVGEVVFLI